VVSSRPFAAAALLLLPACNVSQHRQDFALVAGRDRQLVSAWMRPADSGPGSLWLDTLFFPLDFLGSTWTCLEAPFRDDVAITWGPLGWLATVLPGVSANWYGDPEKSPLPIKPFAPEPTPISVAVQPDDLRVLRSAATDGDRLRAFAEAVRKSLPSGNPKRRWSLDQRLWQDDLVPRLTAVDLGQDPDR
jgi:hypothetical protein